MRKILKSIVVLMLFASACAPIRLGIIPEYEQHDDVITVQYNPGHWSYEEIKGAVEKECGGKVELNHITPTRLDWTDMTYANFKCIKN